MSNFEVENNGAGPFEPILVGKVEPYPSEVSRQAEEAAVFEQLKMDSAMSAAESPTADEVRRRSNEKIGALLRIRSQAKDDYAHVGTVYPVELSGESLADIVAYVDGCYANPQTADATSLDTVSRRARSKREAEREAYEKRREEIRYVEDHIFRLANLEVQAEIGDYVDLRNADPQAAGRQFPLIEQLLKLTGIEADQQHEADKARYFALTGIVMKDPALRDTAFDPVCESDSDVVREFKGLSRRFNTSEYLIAEYGHLNGLFHE